MLSQAQAVLTSYRQFNDSLVAQFNRGDFRAMEAYSSAALRQMEPAGSMSKYLAGLQAKTGRISTTLVLREQGRQHSFEWKGDKQNLRVTLVSSAPGVLDDYTFSDFIAQPQPRPTAARTDNRRKTPLDLAVDQAATLYLQHPDAVGLSVGVYYQGQHYLYNYGEVEKGSGRLPTARTYYASGSIAKTVVGTLLAQAVLDKKARLSDDIRQYLPGAYPNLEWEGQPVQLGHLANHTSGLPWTAHAYPRALQDSLGRLDMAQRTAYYNRYTADSLLGDMHRFKLNSKPGTAYRYNGVAMLVLQLIIERIYQQPYEQLLTSFLKTHYGLADTKRVLNPAERQRYATGYDAKGRPQHQPNYTGYWGGPMFATTPADLLKYAQAALTAQNSAMQLAQQRTWGTAPGFGHGLGWMLDADAAGLPVVYHNGNSPGFNARLVAYPGQDLAFVVLVNDNISQARLTELTELVKQQLPAPAGAAGKRLR